MFFIKFTTYHLNYLLRISIHIVILLLISTFSLQTGYSQGAGFTRANEWKKYRKEITFQAGAAQFLGDLGGLNKVGTHFSPVDLEISLTRPAITAGYRYKFTKNFNWFSSFNYLVVAGDDKLTTEPFRNNRNLNFKSNIFELSTRAELAFFRNKAGHRYNIRNTSGKRYKSNTWELLGFIGIGMFYYNPKGKQPGGGYVKLRRLHTEGQGLPGGPKQYSNVSVSIPIGIAFRAMLNKYWSVGIEINYRKTFTDYIDDVSTVYYDKYKLGQAYGPTSVTMSDPSKGTITGATSPDAAGNAAQRGDKQKDSYMGIQITVGRFFPPKRNKTRLRSKF